MKKHWSPLHAYNTFFTIDVNKVPSVLPLSPRLSNILHGYPNIPLPCAYPIVHKTSSYLCLSVKHLQKK